MVFGYGDIGVRCTRVLLSQGVEVKLVVTHEDDPAENRWYASLAEYAAQAALPWVTPGAIDDRTIYRIHALAPDFIFSFYYRNLLPSAVLGLARRGALNLHGSLLPRFRGRAPVIWAVLRGATETGATLHYMVERADAGDIVDQAAVPILENDTRSMCSTKWPTPQSSFSPAVCRCWCRARRRAASRTCRPANTADVAARKMDASTGHGRRARFTTWCAPSRRRSPVLSASSAANAGW